MVRRGPPPFTKPTRFHLGFQLVSTCIALPRRAARPERHALRLQALERGAGVERAVLRRAGVDVHGAPLPVLARALAPPVVYGRADMAGHVIQRIANPRGGQSPRQNSIRKRREEEEKEEEEEAEEEEVEEGEGEEGEE